MEKFTITISDKKKVAIILKFLEEIGDVKVEKSYGYTSMVSDIEFKGYSDSSNESHFSEKDLRNKNQKKSGYISEKHKSLVRKRKASSKPSDFISLEKFEKQMRKELGY